MNATVQNMLKQYETQVKADTLREVAVQISDLASKYDNLLDNKVAFGIYMQAHGRRYDRISCIRSYLRSKSQMMWKLSGQLIKEAQRLNKMR